MLGLSCGSNLVFGFEPSPELLCKDDDNFAPLKRDK